MTNKRLQTIFAVASLGLLVLVLGLSALMNISSFKKIFTESLIVGYNVSGGDAVRKIEYAVKYGKPIDNFQGMTEIIKEVQQVSPEIEDVYVISPEGDVFYSLTESMIGDKLPDKLCSQADFSKGHKDHKFAIYTKKYHTFIPIYDSGKQWVASLDIVFDESIIQNKVNRYLFALIIYMGSIAVIAALILLLILFRLKLVTSDNKIRKGAILGVIITIIGVAQISFGLINVSLFKKAYVDMSKEHTMLSVKTLQKDIDLVVGKGVPFDELYGIEDWMNRFAQMVPQLQNIYIKDDAGKVIYQTSAYNPLKQVNEEFIYHIELDNDTEGVNHSLYVELSKDYIDSIVKNLVLDILTVLMTSFFFMGELTIFLLLIINRQLGKLPSGDNDSKHTINASLVRSLAFLFFLATSMSVSFVPVLMKQLYVPILGLPENVVLGLPITAEMLGSIITTLIAGYMIDKKGWQQPFFIGFFIIASGIFLCGISASAYMFILARFVVGIGYGLCWMAMRGFVAAIPGEAVRAEGFSSLNAGIYSGINCGCVIGAMLSERIGFSGVFFFALVTISASALFALVFTKNVLPGGLATKDTVEKVPVTRFLFNGNIVLLFLMIIIPSSMCYMFINYFLPVYAKSINISSSNTARAILVYGLVIVYLGPVIGKLSARVMDARKIMCISSTILAVAMLSFWLGGGYWFAVLTILLLAIGDSLGMPAQNNYFLSLDATNEQGKGKALGFYSVAKKTGNMLGPVTFGWAISMGMQLGIGIIGALTFLALLVFMIYIWTSRRSYVSKNR